MRMVSKRWWGGAAPKRPNANMPKGVEYMELSHVYIARQGRIGRYLPDWLVNRGWNLKPQWGETHALSDRFRHVLMGAEWRAEHPLANPLIRLWRRMPVTHKIVASAGVIGGAGGVVYIVVENDQ